MTPKPDQTLNVRRKRLKFQAWHRGTKEVDLLLGKFVDLHLSEFTATDLDWFDQLLNEADQDITDWITGKRPLPEEFDTPLMARLKSLEHMQDGRG